MTETARSGIEARNGARDGAATVPGVRCRFPRPFRLVSAGGAAWVIAERPLQLLRVHAAAARLLGELRANPDVAEALRRVAGLHREAAIVFLERLSDEGLVELRWSLPDELLPSVSVIVPVRNRPGPLAACLEAVSRLDYPRERLEVIVVDDASTDETPSRAEAWRDRLPLRVLRMARRIGAAECRNRGALVAQGEILAFTDSDCLPHPRWLRELVPEFVRPGVVAVGGAVVPADESSWLDRYEAVASPLMHGWEAARVRPRGAVPYLVTANLLVRRQAFVEAGGFARIHPGEDVDLVWRLCERGGRVLYRPNGIVRHDHRDRLWPFATRRASYATSEVVLVQRHPAYRHAVVIPVAILASVLSVVAARVRRRRACATLAVVPFVVDLVLAAGRGRALGAPVPTATVVRAELRGTLAALYWIGRTVSRYFAWPLSLAGTLLRSKGAGRWLLALAWGSLLATASADFVRKRPRLDPLRFVLAHVLDDLANNAGLLAGCLRYRTLRPLQVELRLYWPRINRA
ncbi:MAG: mycofactocin biosynthesis glycosyltransferase MftF [Thermomicrobium sp.]|nr:mycofactocin biosynthesis glycosyltransferase MftF [Thermomicrobium sp.]